MRGPELMTTLTDYLLAAVALGLARSLFRGNGSRAAALWALAFAASGLAALIGGTVHGVGHLVPPGLEQAVRVVTMMAIGTGSTCLLAGVVFASVGPGPIRRLLFGLCALHLTVFLAWIARYPHFRYVAYDSAPAALAVLVFLIRRWRRSGSAAAAQGTAGMLLSMAGAVAQQARLGIHPVWFNHNDLYHVIQAGALWLLHRAGRELRDAALMAPRR